ncbi:alkaline phosphatase family protein [Geoanaerobacter pelophilus]|uniref:alkaline phosphatase family protein n=1 Tax=Geoanaerobacter pelophilus TaxID=60036 RepID=UPI000A2708C5
MQRTVVLNLVGLTRALIGDSTPRLRELSAASVDITSIPPAVTCSMQSTSLTGKRSHCFRSFLFPPRQFAV